MAGTPAADEASPLLGGVRPGSRNGDANANANGNSNASADPDAPANGNGKPGSAVAGWLRQTFLHVEQRLLFGGFLITLSFSFTQVPIFYAFYLMSCDVYYETHPPFEGSGNRCKVDEIAASTSLQFALLAMSTTVCGTFNLFFAGWLVKRVGPRRALLAQILVPAIRVATQILGVLAGGAAGITIFQCTQLVTVLGGPAGYILVMNIIAGEVVEPERRTGVFGMLQGCIMLGQGIGYLTGGVIGDTWGIRRPFEVGFCSFLISAVYAHLALPYISPGSMSDGKKPAVRGIGAFFAPLRVLAPQRIRLQGGKTARHHGLLFLCAGVFLGVVATGYVALLIQLYATSVFDFEQSDNGLLMSGFACMRALFLIVAFPGIIARGRKWYLARHPDKSTKGHTPAHGADDLPTRPEEIEAPVGTFAADEPVSSETIKEVEGARFDLFFLRWSLVLDGALTMCTAFATKKWHIFLAAFLLPFASGSAPAAKGVMTEMCPPSQRADALNALTLVENLANISTQGLFGFVFAALAELGKSYMTFYVNAALALVACGVLLFSHFAPSGSTLIENEEQADQTSTPEIATTAAE
ncbi:major facilitator superfamily domain-containing protein [Lasiosphaeria ovina]|uniref:Major facilitator superfamily domain-containing protein n=1 Tax=Lasiosphaeria ovina TaxID=92902 RepID=A0AAE0K7X4_9PEZI|nr:major facilitator superfamily domain-containing protein [Lasiosphaeria ovina]